MKYKRQIKGQALILTLVFAAATGLVSLLLFNSGMLANSKTRLQNAADAAVYSASVLQARDQNFSAYTNRAMVANQAAVAQIVSLKSFIEDATDTGDRMGGFYLDFYKTIYTTYAVPWDYPIKSAIVPMVSGLNSSFGGYAAPMMTKALNLTIRAYETAQQGHHLATLLDMVQVAEEVVKLNDPHAKFSGGTLSTVGMGQKVIAWSGSMERHSANNSSAAADRFADVVVNKDTTDDFTRGRASVPTAFWFNMPPNPVGCLFHGGWVGPGSLTAYSFKHRGGTQLSSDKKSWLGMDITEGEGGILCWHYVLIGTAPAWHSIYDLSTTHGNGGSGGGLAGNGSYETNGGYKNNPSSTIAYGYALISIPGAVRYSNGPGSSLDSSNGGLQDNYRDMADPSKKPNNQTPEKNGGEFPITMEFERPVGSIRTSSKFLNNGANIIKMDDQLASNNMRAIASAHSYFYRSATNSGFTSASWVRSDGKKEIQNLFNPYWQSRLVDRNDAERAASIAEQMK